jgi:diaminopropionate ammonia-lyase
MKLVEFSKRTKDENTIDFLDLKHAEKVKAFHRSFPMYQPTPLCDLKNLATELAVKKFFVKDESYRFDLNAFKVLGGSFAIGSYIAKKLGMDIADLPYERMISKEIKEKLGDITFVTATDGNHGRGVAWTARQLGQKAVVYMPKGSSKERFDNIKAENADVTITDLNYDDAVRMASEHAERSPKIIPCQENSPVCPKTMLAAKTEPINNTPIETSLRRLGFFLLNAHSKIAPTQTNWNKKMMARDACRVCSD